MSTVTGAVTGGAMGAPMGALGAVAPVRNIKAGALNFDDGRVVGDTSRRGDIQQATMDEMSGENLQAIANEMGITVEEAQNLQEHLLVVVKLTGLFTTQKHYRTLCDHSRR